MKLSVTKNLHKLINLATEEQDPSQLFLNDLVRTIEELDTKGKRKPSTYYKPSSMNCIRKMYFIATGAEQDGSSRDVNNIGITEHGTDRHVRIQNYIAKMEDKGWRYWDIQKWVDTYKPNGIQIIAKMGVEYLCRNTFLNMQFMTDGIIEHIKTGKFYVFEFKTEDEGKNRERLDVVEDHKVQGSCYCTSFDPIEDVIFLYEGRNRFGKKSYLVHVTEQMKQMLVIDLIAECDNYVQKKTPPPVPKVVSCTYCDYKNICRKSEVKLRGRKQG